MINLAGNIKETVDSVGKGIDNNTTTQEEIDEQLSLRHKTDMLSDNWLSKSIRPLTLLILLILQIFLVVASSFGYTADDVIVSQHGILLMTALGFYFRSRQLEKVAKENVKGNIELEKQRERTERQKARQLARLERIEARRKK